MSWPFDLPSYCPELENGHVIGKKFDRFLDTTLSTETAVRVISTNHDPHIYQRTLDTAELETFLNRTSKAKSEFIFVNRFLVKKGLQQPSDPNKLRISERAFRLICYHYGITPLFINTLTNYDQPPGRGCPRPADMAKGIFDFWYLLPVRVQVACIASNDVHSSRPGMKKQMNPLNYLHLTNAKVDIRGSQIGVYFTHNKTTGLSSTFVINLQDGRWSKTIEEPIDRTIDCLDDPRSDYGRHPFFIHSVYLTTALRWWNNALQSFNDQLISYEEELLGEEESSGAAGDVNFGVNRSLRCILAHLHRYESELKLFDDIVRDIRDYHTAFDQFVKATECESSSSFAADSDGTLAKRFDQIAPQVSSIIRFRDEMQQKADNVLALLVDRMQAANDRLLVQNGKAMQLILEAMHKEADQSRALTAAMRKDGVSMKIIALLTTFFLPGTSFAAILAMPFFTQNPWFDDTTRAWVWVALTLPSTILAFMFYLVWTKYETSQNNLLTKS